MQSFYPERFERDMGFSEAEWLRVLPAALGAPPVLPRPGRAELALAQGGRLCLRWQPAPERRLGLVRIARLLVWFEFDGVNPRVRQEFMRRFDLYTRRGGG